MYEIALILTDFNKHGFSLWTLQNALLKVQAQESKYFVWVVGISQQNAKSFRGHLFSTNAKFSDKPTFL